MLCETRSTGGIGLLARGCAIGSRDAEVAPTAPLPSVGSESPALEALCVLASSWRNLIMRTRHRGS